MKRPMPERLLRELLRFNQTLREQASTEFRQARAHAKPRLPRVTAGSSWLGSEETGLFHVPQRANDNAWPLGWRGPERVRP